MCQQCISRADVVELKPVSIDFAYTYTSHITDQLYFNLKLYSVDIPSLRLYPIVTVDSRNKRSRSPCKPQKTLLKYTAEKERMARSQQSQKLEKEIPKTPSAALDWRACKCQERRR
jgi:hypothetical protein